LVVVAGGTASAAMSGATATSQSNLGGVTWYGIVKAT
jgi:hypothetical protein